MVICLVFTSNIIYQLWSIKLLEQMHLIRSNIFNVSVFRFAYIYELSMEETINIYVKAETGISIFNQVCENILPPIALSIIMYTNLGANYTIHNTDTMCFPHKFPINLH